MGDTPPSQGEPFQKLTLKMDDRVVGLVELGGVKIGEELERIPMAVEIQMKYFRKVIFSPPKRGKAMILAKNKEMEWDIPM